MKHSFSSISPSSSLGYFEILVELDKQDESSSYSRFVKSLDELALGDELAFKGGSYRLNYEGKDDPIQSMTVIASGLGIASSLQIIPGALGDPDTTVEDIELLWVNNDQLDFICEKDISSFERKYNPKLFVSKVSEPGLFEDGVDFTTHDKILGSLSAYSVGRIAVICGPKSVTEKFSRFLGDVGYPNDNILCIETD